MHPVEEGNRIPDLTLISSPLRGLRRLGPGTTPITSSASTNSTPAIPGGNPCDFWRICGGRRVQLGQLRLIYAASEQGDARNTSSIQLPRLDTTITFSDSDMEGCQHPHDDLLVVRAVIAKKIVYRVLVDNGSLADIIFASAFDKMGIGREKLEPVNAHLRGFYGERVLPLGSIQLVLTLGDPPCQATTTVRFLIVDAPSAYNILLSRPSLNARRAIPFAYHMVIKFPTTNGVGMVQGDQRIARQCYSASMKQKAVGSIYMDELDIRDEMSTRPTPSKELEPVQLDEQPEHLVYIGSKLANDVRDLLIHFLKQNMEVFA